MKIEDILRDGFYTVSHVQSTTLATNETSWRTKTYYTQGSRELRMAVMYFFSLGYKPKQCKEAVIPLWKNYEPLIDYKRLDATIKYIREHKNYDYHKLEDRQLYIDTGALKYFMELKGKKITEEQLEELKKKRSYMLKNIKAKYFTNDRIKLLITMYMWATKNCETTEETKKHKKCYVNNKYKKLKKESGIHTDAFHEMCGFYDLGLINSDTCLDCYLAGKCRFQDGDPAQKRCEKKKDSEDGWWLNFMDDIELTGEMVEFDINNLDEQMRHICPRCGRWFEPKSNNSTEVCPECKKEENRLRVQKYRAKNKQGV